MRQGFRLATQSRPRWITSVRAPVAHRVFARQIQHEIKPVDASSDGQVDLRSDTVTLPSRAARLAALRSDVGDDVYGEDKTVCQLEQHVAALLGKEKGVFFPSATMGNLAALSALVSRRGDAVLCGDASHVFCWEQGGASSLLGLPFRPLPAGDHPGEFCLEALQQELSAAEDFHVANVGAVVIENTHGASGGRALSRGYVESVSSLCKAHNVPLHVDGARLVNAAAVLADREQKTIEDALKKLAGPADTITLCLSKGLGAPMGAVLVGTAREMNAARRTRKLLGGGMRQVGLAAAAALASVSENLHRIAEDHRLAETLSAGLAHIPGVVLEPRSADATNMVMFKLDRPTGAEERLITALKERHGVLLGFGYQAGQVRAVTHKDLTSACVVRALRAICEELGEDMPKVSSQPPSARYELNSWRMERDSLRLEWADGHVSTYLYVWLRDHSPDSLHPTSRQRQVDTLDIPIDTRPVHVITGEGDLVILWDTPIHLHDGKNAVRESRFSLTWLRQHCYSATERQRRESGDYQRSPVKRKLWSKGNVISIPEVHHESWVSTQIGLHEGMKALWEHGALIVKGTPLSQDGTRVAVERIGVPKFSFYGLMWDTAPKLEGMVNDTAYTNMELKPHTDCGYYKDPPGLQVFNCVQQSDSGGQTWLVDGFSVAETLREHDPAAFHFFAHVPLPSHSIDDENDVHVRTMAPYISLDANGRVVGFRLNNDDRDVLDCLSELEVRSFYEHLPKLLRLTRDPAHSVLVRLGLGDMLIVENTRVMHGRKEFHGRRNLVGCYMDRDHYESRLRKLQILQE